MHYRCDESAGWEPDLEHMASRITERTRAIVVINPNNPTGAVYSEQTLLGIIELARRHGLLILTDEIYDKIVYDGARHHPLAALAPDVPVVSLGGLSKTHRAAGFRSGWLATSGFTRADSDYLEGLQLLANMRICPSVPAQHAIQTALGGYQSIEELIRPGGRLLEQIVALARKHGLIVFADEIYDKTLYDGHTHTSIASLAEDVLFLTFNGLSKNYRSCGYRAGWMVVSGEKRHAVDYIEGLGMLASMRLCSNTPGQLAIQTALGGYQSIDDLVAPGGRLARQRDLAHSLLTAIPGVTCVKPKAALYMFPRLDPKVYPIEDDQQFAYELLAEQKVLIVQGTGFNWPSPDHLRVVFLPNSDDLIEAMGRIETFLAQYRARHAAKSGSQPSFA